jgi:hypothetical protein
MTLPSMVSYTNEETNITIVVPQEWTLETINPSQFRIFGLPESGFEKYFSEYRSTMSYMLAQSNSTDLDWFKTLIQQSNQEMEQEYNQYKLVNQKHCQISDQPAYIKHYEWTEESTDLRLSQLQALIYRDYTSFYLVNAATLKSLEDKYIPIFDAILQSTQIINREQGTPEQY